MRAASSVSRASASAFSAGASRSQSRITATPWIAANRIRNTESAFVPGGNSPASITVWMCVAIWCFISRYESKPLPVSAEARDGAIEKHQREILRVGLAELVQPPEACADLVDGICDRHFFIASKEDSEPLFSERQEDVVLAGKITIDGGRAVLNLLARFFGLKRSDNPRRRTDRARRPESPGRPPLVPVPVAP